MYKLHTPILECVIARPKAFDPDTALRQATHLFWEQGYHATSLSDLEQALGVGRKSLYDTFGNKKQLFLDVLDTYLSVRPPIAAPDAGWAAIVATFNGGPPYDPRHRSCLMVNTALAFGVTEDNEVADRVRRHTALLLEHFERALRRAIADGDLPKQDPAAAARYLCSALQGLSIMSKSGVPFEQLREIAARSLSTVQDP